MEPPAGHFWLFALAGARALGRSGAGALGRGEGGRRGDPGAFRWAPVVYRL